MDTSLVEGYVFLAEILYMFGEERQHVRLAVIGLFAERLVGQRADAAVALQGALAHLEHHAEVLVVVEPFPVKTFDCRRVFRRLRLPLPVADFLK